MYGGGGVCLCVYLTILRIADPFEKLICLSMHLLTYLTNMSKYLKSTLDMH